jgi:hypothetical protein
MEILNRTSKEVVKRSFKNKVTVTFTNGRMYVSKQAMTDFMLKVGCNLVFVIDLGRLYFYVSKAGSEEGFPLCYSGIESKGIGCVNSGMLIRTITDRFPILKVKDRKTHPVRFSNTQINECLTFEILIDKKA